MNVDILKPLIKAYDAAPQQYHATAYWQSYEKRLMDQVASIDVNQLRSGRYPILTPFGFHDTCYHIHPTWPWYKQVFVKFIRKYLGRDEWVLPYLARLHDLRELAYHHCELVGRQRNAKPVQEFDTTDVGSPTDYFRIGHSRYTVRMLSYYLRYCFVESHVRFRGDEVIVELGSGSGFQVEVLKKLYPGLTILCFDLPVQLFLCESYLEQVLGREGIVSAAETLHWKDLSGIQPGKVHFLGNWMHPMLRELPHDLFWNAASFGEMEPEIVRNYLGDVQDQASWIYLLQARMGKEVRGKHAVHQPTTFADYDRMLSRQTLQEEQDAWQAHRRLSESGGYFEAICSRSDLLADQEIAAKP
ncbi:MAG: putative sugar O-methyltransferase [Kiritimatiellae bacterium]|nr:putative sugar O-methyltransferase [Kiritimatiellia bacterium]